MFDRWADIKYTEWAKQVKIRDNYTCQLCHRYGIQLNSHHLNSWDLFIDERYNIDNGITLCVYCHDTMHHIYGKGKNTKFQFLQFKKSLELFRKTNEKIIK